MGHASVMSALSRYRQVGTEGAVEQADPHRLIAMLYEAALSNIAMATACMERAEVAQKGARISRCIESLGTLRASLDMKVAGGLAQRLDALYDYAIRRLFDANATNDAAALAEVARLVRTVAEGWNAIAPARMQGAA